MSEAGKPIHRHVETAQERLGRRRARRDAVAARIRAWVAENAPAAAQAPIAPSTEEAPQ